MTNKLQPRAQVIPNPGSYLNDVVLFTPLAGGKVEINLGDAMDVVDPLASNDKQFTFRASDEELRALLHQLKHYFREGREETYVDGKLEATEKHLKDMRDLVFNHHVNPHLKPNEGILGAGRPLTPKVDTDVDPGMVEPTRRIDSRTGKDIE